MEQVTFTTQDFQLMLESLIEHQHKLYDRSYLFTVSKLLGHTKITTTQIYAKVLDEGRKKAVDAIPDI